MSDLLCVASVCLTALAMQWAHLSSQEGLRKHVDALKLSALLEEKLKELSDLKKKVDIMALKMGILGP